MARTAEEAMNAYAVHACIGTGVRLYALPAIPPPAFVPADNNSNVVPTTDVATLAAAPVSPNRDPC